MNKLLLVLSSLIFISSVFGSTDDNEYGHVALCAPCLITAAGADPAQCPGSTCRGTLIKALPQMLDEDGDPMTDDRWIRVSDPANRQMASAILSPGAACPLHQVALDAEITRVLATRNTVQLAQFAAAHGLTLMFESEVNEFCKNISQPFQTLIQNVWLTLPSSRQAARQAGCFADPTPGPQSTGVIDGNSIAESINAAAVMLGGPGAFDPARPRPVANRNTSSNSATAMTRPPNGVGGGSPQGNGSGPTSGSGAPPTGFSMPTPTLADGSSGGGSSNTTDSGLNASLPSDGKKTDDPAMEDSSEQLAAVDNASSFGAASQGSGRGGAGGSNPLSGMSDLLGSLTGKKGDGDQSNGSASNVNFGTRAPAAAPGATDPEVYLQRNSKLNLFEIIHERMQRF